MALFAKFRVWKIALGAVIALAIVLFCVLKGKPPIAIVPVNSNITLEILSAQRDTVQDVFVGNPLQRCSILFFIKLFTSTPVSRPG